MKSKIIYVFLLTVFFASCSEDVLNIKNENAFDGATFFKTATTIREAGNATYATLLNQGMIQREYYYIFDLFGNDCEKNTALQGGLLTFPNYTHSGSTYELNLFFMSTCRLIFRANFTIDAIAKWAPTATTDIAVANQTLGEVGFLKSLANFWLVTCYGDMPLKKTLADNYVLQQAKTPKAEIWTYIEATLLDAIEKLPVTYAAADYGRVTKGAAIALLGKVYLYQKKYDAAIAQFSKLQATPFSYSLATSLDDMFIKDLKTSETIFAVIHDRWQGAGVGVVNHMLGGRQETIGGNATNTGRAMEYGFADWNNVLVSNALVNSFTYNDEAGKAYIDPRAKLTFYDNLGLNGGDTGYADLTATPKTYASAVGTAKKIFSWRKYELYEERLKNGNPDSWINAQIIRYADVLLMLAESNIEKATPDLAAALTQINQVRVRSGAFQYTTLGTQAQARDILRHERQIELAGEQVRFNDLVRWGTLVETINAEKFAFNGTKPVMPYMVLFPFPQEERDVNPLLNAQIGNNWN
jgi:hypothetical protein